MTICVRGTRRKRLEGLSDTGPRLKQRSQLAVSQQFSHISIRTIPLRAVMIGRLTNLRCAKSFFELCPNVNGASDVCRFAPIYVAMNVLGVGASWCKPGYIQGVRNGYSFLTRSMLCSQKLAFCWLQHSPHSTQCFVLRLDDACNSVGSREPSIFS